MATLLLAEHDNATLSDLTARALTATLALEGPVTLLVAGHDCRAVAEAGATLEGVERVILVDAPQLEHHLAEPLATLLSEMAGDYDAICAAATSTGKNVLPRVAALLDVMQLSDVIGIVSPDTFVRSVYAGNVVETVRSLDRQKVITIRASAFEPAASRTSAAPISAVPAPPAGTLSSVEGRQFSSSEHPDLGSAHIVVSGGRAFGSRENFDAYLGPLAAKLGAAIGASRVAVDSGYADNDLQVGQTGKVVAPRLYIACGISGAVQHLAGMKDSRCIVAINKDPDAPIFKIADYGLVGDVFTILPELTAKL